MNKDIEYYMGLPYTIELIPEADGSWFVEIKELPGCMSSGDTTTEAIEMIQETKRGWLEIALEENLPIPEPRLEEEFSGKFNLRVPKNLHRKLVERAESEGVSLNTYCATALAEVVGNSKDGYGSYSSLRFDQYITKEKPPAEDK